MPLAQSRLSGPYNGLAQKIAFIKRAYLNSLPDPRLRRFLEDSMGRGPRLTQAIRLYHAIRDRVHYVPDPVGVEYTKSPSEMFNEMEERGYAAGDCDDQTALSYALLNIAGIPAKIRVAWFDSSPYPSHIYTVAIIEGKEYPFDTARKSAAFGVEDRYDKAQDF